MENGHILSLLPDALLPWYGENRRELPWRADREPYHVWLSKIMLQQTRVEAVKGYYTRFLEAFPTVEALAGADEAHLHKLWEGLGYYSRVRNLHKAARIIAEQMDGVFPETYDQVRELPGVGPYTAGAICSIAFDLPTPAVDGNVLRVFSRLTDDHTPVEQPALKMRAQKQLAEVYPDRAGDFTQALMELGATVCGPNRKPDCESCPCQTFCLARQRKTAQFLPVRQPKRTRRQEDLTVLIMRCGDRYGLEKRPDGGLLAGLWQFPNLPGHWEIPVLIDKMEQMGLKVSEIYRQVEKKHIFTHIQWRMRGVYVELREENNQLTWLTAQEITNQTALPTAFRQFWEEIPD